MRLRIMYYPLADEPYALEQQEDRHVAWYVLKQYETEEEAREGAKALMAMPAGKLIARYDTDLNPSEAL